MGIVQIFVSRSTQSEIVAVNATEYKKHAIYCQYCLCTNTSQGISTNCTKLKLLNPPRNLNQSTIELILKGNFIQEVRYHYLAGLFRLKLLDLSENKIKQIEVGAFKDLVNLTHLFLNGEKHPYYLFVPQSVFKPGVFDGLSNLKVLRINNNVGSIGMDVSKLPVDALITLVSLEELEIDGLPNVTFDERFKQLKNLSRLVMSGFSGGCEIGMLDRQSLLGLENIQYLTLEQCMIKKISTETFWSTPKLKCLDLSWNTELEIFQLSTFLEELQYTNLETLKINAIHNPNKAGTEILRPYMKHMREVKISELHLNDNGIEFIDYGVFEMFPKTLKRLYMRRNKLIFGLYMYEAVFNNPNLEVFDAGDQAIGMRSDRAFTSKFDKGFNVGLSVDRTSKRSIGSNLVHVINSQKETAIQAKARSKREYATISLQILICSGSLSDIRPMDFTNTTNNITFMDLSRNYMSVIHFHAFYGLFQLQYLNISHNYAEKVHPDAFIGLIALEMFDLENNLLGNALNEDRNGMLFSSLHHLKEINLARNRINKIDKNVFLNTLSLQRLNLSDNYIEQIELTIRQLKELNMLDLSTNRLELLPRQLMDDLNKLSKVQDIHVNLSNNKLACTCESVPFLRWLFTSAIKFHDIDKYYCSFNNGTIKVLNSSRLHFLENLEEECKSYLEIIVSFAAGGSFIAAVVTSYVVYRHRWKFRYLYYMAKVKMDIKENENLGQNFEYDAFISYGDGDRAFVIKDMVENLENNGHKRLMIRDRDFELGEVIALSISKAIRTSKKTFLLVSRYFLRNKWCNFEMNMAWMEEIHMKRKVIVIIFLEKIPTNVLPLELMNLLRECPNTDVPTDDEIQAAFWDKCIGYINDD